MQAKRKILVLIDWFLPGIKAGGPVKSVSSMINTLNGAYDFYILTSDTDFGDTQAYVNITPDKWVPYKEGVSIQYLSKNNPVANSFLKAIELIKPDVVYINSYFSKNYSIVPLQLIRKHKINTKVILAPRGMLSEGALRIKPFKKKAFIAYSRITGLHNNLLWHSTKADETSAIKKVYSRANVFEAQNISDMQLRLPDTSKVKKKGHLQLVYLGRIAENKNLLLVLNAMREISGAAISLDIYGSREDESYWNACEQKIAASALSVKYKGLLKPEDISQTIRKYHFLIQLSYSENFGHSIVEALSNGLPVIISNTTPWRNLHANNAGWDVAINNNDAKETVDALQQSLALDQQAYAIYAKGAYSYAEKYCVNKEVVEKLKLLFS